MTQPHLPDPLTPPTVESKGFLLLLVVVTLAFGWVIYPFFGAVLWAVIIAILFAPLHRRILHRVPRRHTSAALATLGIIVLAVILPLALLTASLAQDAASIYAKVKSGEINVGQYFARMIDALPAWLSQWLERAGLADFEALQQRVTASLAQGTDFIARHVMNVGQNTFDFLVSTFVMLYLAFFLLRDGGPLSRRIIAAVPLRKDHKRQIFQKFAAVVRATVKGSFVVAAVQGALGGVAFAFLGIGGALLWGTLMAILSLLPAVGAALVWLPVALYLLASGQTWQGVALVAYGVLVIGLVDNVLRPLLIGKDTKMPDWVVLISTLGGISIFGANGFVIGPVIAALFMSSWDIFARARHKTAERQGRDGGEPPDTPQETAGQA